MKKTKRKIYLPKKLKQSYAIADNGRKVRHGVSVAEGLWLDKLRVVQRSKVIILLGKTYVVDGFDAEKNTCYEYLGSTFHGSHLTYPNNRNLVDKWLKKSPEQLYLETRQRFIRLTGAGFKVFFVWDFQEKKGQLGRYFKGNTDTLY